MPVNNGKYRRKFKIKIKISQKDQDTARSCIIFMLENLTALSVKIGEDRIKVHAINRAKSRK
ncbi:hypothetical protein ES705_09900 [subsurface metagenome]